MTNPLHSLWNNHPAPMDAYDVLREAMVAIERGTAAVEPARTQFVRGVGSYLAGDGDLDSCLGLRARRGRANEEPRRRAAARARNELIHQALTTYGGVNCASAEWLSKAVRGDAPIPAGLVATVAELRQLKRVRGQLSGRHLLRLAQQHASRCG